MVRTDVYSPERVNFFQNIFDSAWEDLVTSGSPLAQYVNAEATRTAIARQIIAYGNSGMTPEEIKRAVLQKVVRTF
jgi:ribonucleotide monophosphatase NagD (HAD superfamily)